MKYRKDIHDFLKNESPRAFKCVGYIRDARPYEQDGNLYRARFDDGGAIQFFVSFEPKNYECQSLAGKVKEKFEVEVAPDEVVCRCGDKEHFAAYYGNYRLMLRCQCGHEFSAYSG